LVNKDFLTAIPYSHSSDSAAMIVISINRRRKQFMVDTGAPLVISRSLQDELSFPVLQSGTTIDSSGDSVRIEIVRVNELSIGPLLFKDIPSLVVDFNIPAFSCDTIDGIIGSNLLRMLVVQFNKAEQKIYFTSHVDSLHPPENTTSTELFLNPSQSEPAVAVRINSLVDTVLYDSGDKTLYTISQEWYNENKNASEFKIIAQSAGREKDNPPFSAASTETGKPRIRLCSQRTLVISTIGSSNQGFSCSTR
jgi:predicted aspartyl protease